MLSKSAADILHRFVSVCHKENSFIFCVDDYAKTIGAIALRSAQTREELEWIIEQQEQSREAESDMQRDEKADRQR